MHFRLAVVLGQAQLAFGQFLQPDQGAGPKIGGRVGQLKRHFGRGVGLVIQIERHALHERYRPVEAPRVGGPSDLTARRPDLCRPARGEQRRGPPRHHAHSQDIVTGPQRYVGSEIVGGRRPGFVAGGRGRQDLFAVQPRRKPPVGAHSQRDGLGRVAVQFHENPGDVADARLCETVCQVQPFPARDRHAPRLDDRAIRFREPFGCARELSRGQ